MNCHITRRAPKQNKGLSWGRFPTIDGSAVTYRLFRRDHAGALHMLARTFLRTDPRAYIASRIRRIKRALRDRVNEIELTAMEQQDARND
ncbi:hypothetical protein [Stenotrophomonas sp. NLF4-10]|uniref:hypothetical protein n=1 Tax=Stenotrophomonas sp. NLF4-10 TaxID=2918754 RepID=UPI001EFB082A|nr:hypothetical protein [Stenotrophomonas sp. NLF4-10]MCG8275373.1 hypothetical protein [Stenotrophomonas sp. NLF4-10]